MVHPIVAAVGFPEIANQLQNTVANPITAAKELADLLNSTNIVQALRDIGIALLYIFALIEMYRLWFRGTGADFGVLAAKVAIIQYLIGPGSPIPTIAGTVLAWSFHAAVYIVGQAGVSIARDIVDAFGSMEKAVLQSASVFNIFTVGIGGLVTALMALGLMLFYLAVFAVILAVYTFALLSAAVIYALAIVLVPVLFPMFIWPETKGFGHHWVSTMLHALFMPIIGATLVYVSLAMGLAYPIKHVADCFIAARTDTDVATCMSAAAGGFILGAIAGIASILLMFSVDRVVSNFFPASMVSIASLIAARFAIGGPAKAVSGAIAGAIGSALDGGGGGGAGAATTTATGAGGATTSFSSAPSGREPAVGPSRIPVGAGVSSSVPRMGYREDLSMPTEMVPEYS